MATTYELIDSVTLGSNAASVTFSSIPGTYDDLVISASLRETYSGLTGTFLLRPNGATTNLSYRMVYGSGSSAASEALTDRIQFYGNGATSTSNTFGSIELLIPNYAGSTAKSVSISFAYENNATYALVGAVAGLWNSTSAITSLEIHARPGENIVAGSSLFLYGITKA